jgi:uncharacterized protein (TIGR03435 family)
MWSDWQTVRSPERIEIAARQRSPRGAIARFALSMAAMIAIGGSMGPHWIAYGQTRAAFKSTQVPCSNMASITRTPQRIAFKVSLVGDIMAFAFDLPLDRIERRPQWMYDDCYDAEVTTASPASLPAQKQMLQKLLEERFGLIAHRISYPSPVYFLVRGPKVKLTESAEPDAVDIPEFRNEPLPPGFPVLRAVYATHISTSGLADWLYQRLQLPVVDKTGITGLFDIEITGIPLNGTADGIIRAVRDSLGLALEVQKGTAESLIIDHVEKPREN